MKKAGQWKNRMVLALELPPDLAYNETIVTLTGQTEAVIEIINLFLNIHLLKL